MMNKTILILILLTILFVPSSARAQLDFDQEVIVIPETHDVESYIWKTSFNPWVYKLSLKYDKKVEAGKEIKFEFSIKHETEEALSDMHVFITDRDLKTYKHVRPELIEGKYRFLYSPPWPGKYRFEIVFRGSNEWINLSKNIKIKGNSKNKVIEENLTDEGYSIKIKTIPEIIYAEHVTSFIYEISYNGQPLKDTEKIDGFDMQVAAWGESLKHFIYATPRQNIGGSKISVSMVFPSPRKYTIYSEFKHNGRIRKIEYVVDVLEEVIRKPGGSYRNDLYN